jgi:hypothetical protein
MTRACLFSTRHVTHVYVFTDGSELVMRTDVNGSHELHAITHTTG